MRIAWRAQALEGVFFRCGWCARRSRRPAVRTKKLVAALGKLQIWWYIGATYLAPGHRLRVRGVMGRIRARRVDASRVGSPHLLGRISPCGKAIFCSFLR